MLVGADGSAINVDNGETLAREAVRALRDSCAQVSTVTAGPNAAARADSDRDLVEFLRREFRLEP